MNHRIIKHATALLDLEEGAEFLRKRDPRMALQFIDAAEETFRRLAAMPGLGTRYEPEDAAYGELRFLPLSSRFKHSVVFYRPIPGGIEVARVLHGSRDIHGILEDELGDVNEE